MGNRVMMLHEKKLYANAVPEEFFASQDPVIRQFVANDEAQPSMTSLPAAPAPAPRERERSPLSQREREIVALV